MDKLLALLELSSQDKDILIEVEWLIKRHDWAIHHKEWAICEHTWNELMRIIDEN